MNISPHLFITLVAIIALSTSSSSNLFVAASASGGVLHLLDPAQYPEALCLDGTPAGMYVHMPFSLPKSGGASLIFHMQGGGMCPTLDACYMRAGTDLGSSSSWSPTVDSKNDGFLSGNCTINSPFCSFIRVRLNYCDGNLFSGARADPIPHSLPDSNASKLLYFRGTQIREAALHYLYHKVMARIPGGVSSFIVSGDSAGGLATFMHADEMVAQIQSLAGGALKKVAAVPLSGFFPGNVVSLDGNPIIHEAWKSMLTFCDCEPSANKDCAAWAKANGLPVYLCLQADYGFRFNNKVPFFAMQSSSDAWQIACELLSGPGPEPGTEACYGVPGYGPTTGCPSDSNHPAFGNCSLSKVTPLIKYQDWFRGITIYNTSENNGWARNSTGYFLISCYKHVAGLGRDWYKTKIAGATMPEALTRWWKNLDGGGQQPAVVRYVDCRRTVEMSSTGYECNPTCNPDYDREHDATSTPESVWRRKYGNTIGLLF